MKKIGNRPITEADTNFSKISIKNQVSERFQEVSRAFKSFCGKQNWHCGIDCSSKPIKNFQNSQEQENWKKFDKKFVADLIYL